MNTRNDHRRISIHHVGGRGGEKPFPTLDIFEKDFVNVLYEADRDCIEQIRAGYEACESELHVIPCCLGQSSRAGTLHINYDPFTSSLREFDSDYGPYYYHNFEHDYVFSETTATMEKRDVAITTLDSVIAGSNALIPPPDFLSIDTQGSEYEILLGAAGLLESNVVAIVAEVEFHPLYRGQKLFGDLVNLLSGSGFHFVRFLARFKDVAPFRAPIGLRGEGFHLFGDALFLRRISSIEAVQQDTPSRCRMLKKLAFISIVYKQFEFALQCLRAARQFTDDRGAQGGGEPTYLTFLEELEGEIGKMPEEWPRNFASIYTFAGSKARFSTRRRKNDLQVKISMSKQAYAMNSVVEALLVKYGFRELAELLKRNRLIQKSISDFLAANLAANPDFEKENRIAAVKFNVE